MRFSIILPVYNVKDFIGKCLRSIVEQDFTDYEIVVVDDESPDNSMQIVEEFAKVYPQRFQIIHQKNKGLGGARNTGAAAASGEYLFFVDSDDYIEKSTLSLLDGLLTQNPCDILMFQYSEVLPTGEVINQPAFFAENGLYETPQQKAELLLTPPSAWSKIFRRKFFQNSKVLFPEKTLYEDGVTRILIAKAERIFVCKEHLYQYVQRQGSIMNSNVSPRILDIIKVTDLVYASFVAEGLIGEYKDHIEAALVKSAFYVVENVYQQAKNDSMLGQIIDYLVVRFPDYQENPLLAKGLKQEIRCLADADYFRYRCIRAVKQAKGKLVSNPILSKISSLRKK